MGLQLRRALKLKKQFPNIELNVPLINSRKFNEFYPGDKVYVMVNFFLKKAIIDGYDGAVDKWIITYEEERKGSYELKTGKELLIYDTAIMENVKENFEPIIWETMFEYRDEEY